MIRMSAAGRRGERWWQRNDRENIKGVVCGTNISEKARERERRN